MTSPVLRAPESDEDVDVALAFWRLIGTSSTQAELVRAWSDLTAAFSGPTPTIADFY